MNAEVFFLQSGPLSLQAVSIRVLVINFWQENSLSNRIVVAFVF